MTRKIIRIGTSPNDGTGDTLRETANKINYNFTELYGVLGIEGCGADISIRLQPSCGSDLILTTCGTGKVIIGDPENPVISIPSPTDPSDVVIRPPSSTKKITIGDPTCGSTIDVPGCTTGDPISIGNPEGPRITVPPVGSPDPITIGDPEGPKITLPPPGSNDPITIGDPSGPSVTLPPPGSTDPITIGDPSGPKITLPPPGSTNPITIGDPEGPKIVIPPKDSDDPITIGDPSDPTKPIKIGDFEPYKLLYTDGDGNIKAGPYLGVGYGTNINGYNTLGWRLELQADDFNAFTTPDNRKQWESRTALYFTDTGRNVSDWEKELVPSNRHAAIGYINRSDEWGYGKIRVNQQNYEAVALSMETLANPSWDGGWGQWNQYLYLSPWSEEFGGIDPDGGTSSGYEGQPQGKPGLISIMRRQNPTASIEPGLPVPPGNYNRFGTVKIGLGTKTYDYLSHGVTLGWGALAVGGVSLGSVKWSDLGGETLIVLNSSDEVDGGESQVTKYIGQISTATSKVVKDDKGVTEFALGWKAGKSYSDISAFDPQHNPARDIHTLEDLERVPGKRTIIWNIEDKVSINEAELTDTFNVKGNIRLEATPIPENPVALTDYGTGIIFPDETYQYTAWLGTGLGKSIDIVGTENEVEVTKTGPTYTVGLPDDVIITGNLTVNGTTTTINSTTLTVDDKNIEIGSVDTPTDTTANGGGITLKGATDKTIIWDQPKDRWVFNKGVDVVDAVVNNLTANKFVKTDADKKLISDDITWDDIQPAPCGNDITIGNDCDPNNGKVKIPGNGGPITVGDPSNPSITVPPPSSTDPVKIGKTGGPAVTVPPPGSTDPIKIGDPTNPGIKVPSNNTDPIEIGRPGQPVNLETGLDKWELIYTGANGKLDSSPFLKVTEDGDDNEGKSLHLHTALYSTGPNTKLQSAIYFVDDVADPNRGGYANEITESKRAASIRFVKQSFGQGLILSPYDNYNDTAFHNKGGVSTWRAPLNSVPQTKVTLNDDAVGPSIHGLYLGRGAISFFQDLAGGSTPDTDGLAYVVLPGIPDGSGVNKVGQIFANPYRNRTEDGNSGVPYFGFGWKQSTQLVESGGGTDAIEEAERTPGQEVLTWHTTNRVGVMNNDPNWTLSVTGDVAFTKTLRVGDAENAGSNGQVLTSTGDTTAPTWVTPADQRLSVVDDPNSNTNLKLMMTPETSGRISEAKIDSADLTYNPSTGTLTTPNLLVRDSGVDFTGAVNALYYGSAANRVTLANYNSGGNITFEVNGGAYTAHFNADGTYQFANLYTTAVGAAPKPISVGSDGIIGYDDRIATKDTLYDAGDVSGSVTLDRNNGTIQKARIVGNITSLSISNMTVAQSFTIIFTQDGTGSRTLTTSSAFKYASGYKTLSTAAGSVDMLNIFYDGSTYYCTLTTGYA